MARSPLLGRGRAFLQCQLFNESGYKSRLSTGQCNAKAVVGMLRQLYTEILCKAVSCGPMLKMTELLDRSKYLHLWSCWVSGICEVSQVLLGWWGGAGVSCLYNGEGRVGSVCGAVAGCVPCRAGGEVRHSPRSSAFPRLFPYTPCA